ncbi:MAG: toprim domain-containing protein [Oscillospiraceae bacterium]|nr:toprim domain-containing protein [Oscillospiraceae bacterium]
MKKTYDNDSISALKGADRVRKRPGVIFGSDGLEGCVHAVFEILSNSIDEAREGHGSKITLTRYKDDSIEVADNGRGCPVDWNEKEGRFNWELVFCELYAGGKYDTGDGHYEYSLGLNGLGACATQYASRYMDVRVLRDGFEYTLRFERGENIGGLQKAPSSGRKTGSVIRWLPDLEVFTEIGVPREVMADMLKRQAVVNPGVTFVLRYEGEKGFATDEYRYEHGILDYVRGLSEGATVSEPLLWEGERRGRDRADKPEYKVKLGLSFAFVTEGGLIEHYHNSAFLEHGGSPEKALRSAFTAGWDSFLKTSGKYQKNESKITFNDIADSLVLVSSNFSTQTSYENQTKKAITNKFVQECMAEFIRENLAVFCLENRQTADKIAERLLINKRSRETAEKTRLGLKKKLSGGVDISARVQKYVDCRSRDPGARELYIVEGDSALGACKLGRDAEFQAIIPVRGKILNCLKADYDKIFKNEIITDLIRVLGCGAEVKAKHPKDVGGFDLGGLRFSKVVICTDADYDGFQIRTLILTMLYRLTPGLIENGYVYIAESPLFELRMKGKTAFAYSDAEKNEILSRWGTKGVTVSRSKGLGENEPDMMWLTTMNPLTRRLIKINPEDADRTAEVFDLLLGDNLAGRKEYIANYGALYLEMADLS